VGCYLDIENHSILYFFIGYLCKTHDQSLVGQKIREKL